MTKQEQFDEIMGEFNFETVLEYMDSVRWTWADTSRGSNEIPAIEDLKETAKELLTEVIFNGVSSASTGGFLAYQNGKDYGLAFCIEHQENWVDEIDWTESNPF